MFCSQSPPPRYEAWSARSNVADTADSSMAWTGSFTPAGPADEARARGSTPAAEGVAAFGEARWRSGRSDSRGISLPDAGALGNLGGAVPAHRYPKGGVQGVKPVV